MITKYNIYIKENNTDDFKLIIHILNNINKKYYIEKFVCFYNTDTLHIRDNENNKIFQIFIKNNKMSIYFRTTMIFQTFNINYLNDFINKNIELYQLFSCFNIEDYHEYKNLTASEFIKKYKLYQNKYFVQYLKNKQFSKNITEEYKYIIDASNFDLI